MPTNAKPFPDKSGSCGRSAPGEAPAESIRSGGESIPAQDVPPFPGITLLLHCLLPTICVFHPCPESVSGMTSLSVPAVLRLQCPQTYYSRDPTSGDVRAQWLMACAPRWAGRYAGEWTALWWAASRGWPALPRASAPGGSGGDCTAVIPLEEWGDTTGARRPPASRAGLHPHDALRQCRVASAFTRWKCTSDAANPRNQLECGICDYLHSRTYFLLGSDITMGPAENPIAGPRRSPIQRTPRFRALGKTHERARWHLAGTPAETNEILSMRGLRVGGA
jgi:hypothetical protein